jgi:hypothetical protein
MALVAYRCLYLMHEIVNLRMFSRSFFRLLFLFFSPFDFVFLRSLMAVMDINVWLQSSVPVNFLPYFNHRSAEWNVRVALFRATQCTLVVK